MLHKSHTSYGPSDVQDDEYGTVVRMLALACNEVGQCVSQVDGVALNLAIKKVELLLSHHTDAVRCTCKRASNHSMHVPVG